VTAAAGANDPAVSIVIPAHNAVATLGAQLEAVRAQANPETEIIVVDNNSTDGTRALVERTAAADPRVRLVPAHEGAGPSYARNVGVAAARAEHVLCCDADDVVADGWFDALSGALSGHPFAGGPIEVDRLNPRWLADGRGRWGVDQPGKFGGIEFAHGCNLGIRRSLYLAAGGLDERLHAGEEIDLALRLQSAGTALAFVPDAVVHYRYRDGIRPLARQAFAYGRVVATLNARGADVPGFAPAAGDGRRVLWLGAHLFDLFDRTGRVRWTWIAASIAGRLAGRLTGRLRPQRHL
jgi:glycosyltransferase involved in cell wall biosynthesis